MSIEQLIEIFQQEAAEANKLARCNRRIDNNSEEIDRLSASTISLQEEIVTINATVASLESQRNDFIEDLVNEK